MAPTPLVRAASDPSHQRSTRSARPAGPMRGSGRGGQPLTQALDRSLRWTFVIGSEVLAKSSGRVGDVIQLLQGQFTRGQGVPQSHAHGWPFTCGNREHDGVAESTVRSNRVAAQYSIFLCAQSGYCLSGLAVVPMSAKLYGNSLQIIEGVGQLEKLRLSVRTRTLSASSQPSRADFQSRRIGARNHKGRHANDSPR